MCQESQKTRILSRDFSQPEQSGSDTDRQTNRQTDAPLTEGPNPIGVWTLKTYFLQKLIYLVTRVRE